MSGDPLQNSLGRCDFRALGQFGPVYHNDRQAQRAGSFDFGRRASASCVFANNDIDAMFPKQRRVPSDVKRAARHHNRVAGQGRRRIGRVNQSQDVVVLRLCRELVQMQPSKRQHHALRRAVQRGDGACHVGNNSPVVTRHGLPGRARQCHQMRPGFVAGLRSVPAHLRGKRVRGINNMADVMVANVLRQTFSASKTTFTARDRLRFRIGDASRVAEGRSQTTRGDKLRQGAGLGCAAQNKEVLRHVC